MLHSENAVRREAGLGRDVPASREAAAGEGQRLLRALTEATARAEAVLRRLEASQGQADRTLREASELAQTAAAVAQELKEDVGSLITALQGLAGEVDERVREHTAGLMALMSESDLGREAARNCGEAIRELEDQVRGSMEEMQRTASDIAAEMDGKAGEMRLLIAESSRLVSRMEQLQAAGEAQESRTSPNPDDGVRGAEPGSDAPSGSGGRRYSQALELAARGLEADEIARRCGLGREEVRVLLRLRPQMKADRGLSA